MDDNNTRPFSKLEWIIILSILLIFISLMFIFKKEIHSSLIWNIYYTVLFCSKNIFKNIKEYIENQKRIEKENKNKWQK